MGVEQFELRLGARVLRRQACPEQDRRGHREWLDPEIGSHRACARQLRLGDRPERMVRLRRPQQRLGERARCV